MAKLIFTEEDERLIESLMEEFDPAKKLSGLRMRDRISAEAWDFLVTLERTRLARGLRAAVITASLPPLPGDVAIRELFGQLLEAATDVDEEIVQSRSIIRIQESVPFDVIEGYDDATWNLQKEPVCRVLGIDFQPVS